MLTCVKNLIALLFFSNFNSEKNKVIKKEDNPEMIKMIK